MRPPVQERVRPLQLGHLVEDPLPHGLDVAAELNELDRPVTADRAVDVLVGDVPDLMRPAAGWAA